MTTYYIDPVLGNDSNTAGQAQSSSTPWQTWNGSNLTTTLSTANNSYLQKCGTASILSATLAVVAAQTTISSYLDPVSGSSIKPVLSISFGSYTGVIASNSLIYCGQRNLTVTNISMNVTNGFGISVQGSFQNTYGTTIGNCLFNVSQPNNGNQIRAIYFNDTSFSIYSTSITNCDFTGNGGESLIGSFPHSHETYSWTIRNNTFHDTNMYGIHFIGQTAGVPNHHDIYIQDNTFLNVAKSVIAIDSGIISNGFIQRNKATNTGTLLTPNVNAIQLNWVSNSTISDNIITSVVTSAPDGCGIILDFGWANNSYCSSNNIVRKNIVSNCSVGDGIQVWKGFNNYVYSNIVFGCVNGIAACNTQSTGNLIINNLAFSNSIGGIAQKFNAGVNTFVNNLSYSNQTDFYYENTASQPINNNNAFITYTGLLSLGSNNVTTNPLLGISNPQVPMLSNSSPCKNAGRFVGYYTDFRGYPFNTPPTIGSFEFTARSHR